MDILEASIFGDGRSPDFQANKEHNLNLLNELRSRLNTAEKGGGAASVAVSSPGFSGSFVMCLFLLFRVTVLCVCAVHDFTVLVTLT